MNGRRDVRADAAEPTPVKIGTSSSGRDASSAFAYLFVPLLTIVVFSFNEPDSRFNTSWNQFTCDNWSTPSPRPTTPTPSSCRCGWPSSPARSPPSSAALIALALSRYQLLGGKVLNLLLVLPLTTPEIVFGASLFTLFFNQACRAGSGRSSSPTPCSACRFVALTVKARIRGLDWSLEDAAADLGSSAAEDVLHDHVPADPAGHRWRRSCCRCRCRSTTTSSRRSSPATSSTFPREIFDSAKVEIPPQIHVIATLIMVVAIVVLVAGTLWGNRRRARAA